MNLTSKLYQSLLSFNKWAVVRTPTEKDFAENFALQNWTECRSVSGVGSEMKLDIGLGNKRKLSRNKVSLAQQMKSV